MQFGYSGSGIWTTWYNAGKPSQPSLANPLRNSNCFDHNRTFNKCPHFYLLVLEDSHGNCQFHEQSFVASGLFCNLQASGISLAQRDRPATAELLQPWLRRKVMYGAQQNRFIQVPTELRVAGRQLTFDTQLPSILLSYQAE